MHPEPNQSRSQAQKPKGFIPLPRTFFDHPLWKQKRALSPAEALLDIYRLARCLPTETLKRGQLQRSEPELAERWQWTRSRVSRFLKARIQDGVLRLAYARAGDIPVYEIPEIAQTAKIPTKPANAQGADTSAEPPKAAPVVEAVPMAEPVSEPRSNTPRQKKERTKERKASEFRDVKNGESEDGLRPEEAGSIELPAAAPPVVSLVPQTQAGELTPEERELAIKWFFQIVPREQWALKLPLSKEQVRGLRVVMRNKLVPWPEPGSRLAREMQRPV